MTTKTTTALPLGWRRYRWPLLRAHAAAWLRQLDVDPWLIMAALIVAAIVVYGRTQAPASLAPTPITPIARHESGPVIMLATVLVVPTAAPTAIPTAVPPTAIPTVEPPPPVEQPAVVEAQPASLLAAPTPPPPTPEPTAGYPAWYTDIPTPAPWLVAACKTEAGRRSWVCGGAEQEAGKATP